MSYLAAVNLIKDVSEAVNSSGLFVHTNRFAASLEFSEVSPQIILFQMGAPVDMANHYYETWTILMAFHFQDAPDSTPLEQQSIIAQADNMVTEFMAIINEVEGVQVSNYRKEPAYRALSGTYSGMILSFNLGVVTDLCSGGIVYPDLPNYPNLKNIYALERAGTGDMEYSFTQLIGAEILQVTTDGLVRSENEYSFNAGTGTITFISEVEGRINILYKK